MDKKKRLISIIAAILVGAMVLGFVSMIAPVFASAEEVKSSSTIKAEINDLKKKKAEIDDKIDELEGQVSDNMEKMEDIVAQKQILDQEIALLHDQVNAINEQITSYRILIADKQTELNEATDRLAELNTKNKERIRAMEEEGKLSYWSVLFKANSFTDLLDRFNMIEEIAAADQRRLEELNQAARAVETAKKDLETEKAALEDTRAELDATQVQLDQKKAEADELLSQLLATGVEYQKLLDEEVEKTETMMQELNQLDAEYKKAKDREYQEWLAAHPPAPPTPSGGSGGSGGAPHTVDGVSWLVPINYVYVSSPFGQRYHPIYGYTRMHYGVDLAAPKGTPIIASRSGVVTAATYSGGAGNYVNINHMDGFSTRYMHMTNYIVSPGQNVSAGQVIGYCGSTGASTGPHLHFGVYYNGTAVNPANYISI